MEAQEQNLKLYHKSISAYYGGNPIISDEAFDALEKQLIDSGIIKSKIRFEPANTIEVGHTLANSNETFMAALPSLAAIHTKSVFDETLYKHIASNITKTPNMLAMLKYDGMSCEATYDAHGNLLHVATKGDGSIGYDVTAKFIAIGKVPLKIDNVMHRRIQIRFEAVIDKQRFLELSELGYKNERNAASGIVKRQDLAYAEYIDPIAYIITFVDDSNTLRMLAGTTGLLKRIGWPEDYIAGSWPIANVHDFIHECELIANGRDDLQYRIDGVVIYPHEANVSGHHDFAYDIKGGEYANMVALKLDAMSAVTRVTKIDWRQRINGELFPRVELEPVQLDGTTVSAASAFNYGFLKDNNIWPGALVRIEKGGDIIPDIQECLEAGDITKADIPEHAYVDGIHLMLPDEYALPKRFMNGVLTLGVDGLGWSNANRIFDATQSWLGKMPMFEDFYKLLVEDCELQSNQIAQVLHFDMSKKSDAKVIDGIVNRLKHMYADQYFRCLQIPGLGSKACWQLAMHLSDCEHSFDGLAMAPIDDALNNYCDVYVKYVGSYIVDGKQMLEEMEAQKQSQQSTAKVSDTIIKVVMTGSPKSAGFKTKSELLAAHPELQDVGDDVDNCDLVLTNDMSKSSSKMRQAQARGTKIVTYDNFVMHPEDYVMHPEDFATDKC